MFRRSNRSEQFTRLGPLPANAYEAILPQKNIYCLQFIQHRQLDLGLKIVINRAFLYLRDQLYYLYVLSIHKENPYKKQFRL